MKTFRQFLEDIEIVSDMEYSRHDSDNDASEHDRSIKGQKKAGGSFDKTIGPYYDPFDVKFSDKAFELHQKRTGGDISIVLVHKKSNDVAIVIKLQPKRVDVLGRTFGFVSSDILSAAKPYQGKGLAPLVYDAIIRSGEFVLASSQEQTEGGQKTWKKVLDLIDDDIVYALVDSEYAVSNIPAAANLKATRGEYMIAKGSKKLISLIAYDSYPNRLLIIPKGLQQSFVKNAVDAKGTTTL